MYGIVEYSSGIPRCRHVDGNAVRYVCRSQAIQCNASGHEQYRHTHTNTHTDDDDLTFEICASILMGHVLNQQKLL